MRNSVERTGEWSMRRDEDLLAEYVENKTREAFEELVHRYEREMYIYLRRYLRSAELAEDAFRLRQIDLKCDTRILRLVN
jgi:pantothenate kinase-related protein Tda10